VVTQFTMSFASLGILRQLYRKTQRKGCKFVHMGRIQRTVLPRDQIVFEARPAQRDKHQADGQTSGSACAQSNRTHRHGAAGGSDEGPRQPPASCRPAVAERTQPRPTAPGWSRYLSRGPHYPATSHGCSPAPWTERSPLEAGQTGTNGRPGPRPPGISPSGDTGRSGHRNRSCRLPALPRAWCNFIQA